MAEALPSQPSTKEELKCRFCEKTFNTVLQYIDHIRCKEHYKMVNISEKKSKAELLEKFKEMEDLKKDRSFLCPECETRFTGWTNADDHFRSSQHMKRISENEMNFILYNMKPKIVPPTIKIKHHPLSSVHQKDTNCKKMPHSIDKTLEAAKESVNHCDGKMLNSDKRVDGELEKAKVKLKTNGIVAATKLEKSSPREKVKKCISESEIKEGTSKSDNAKVYSRKVNTKNSKEKGVNRSDSFNDEIQPNEIVRSTKGIAYFLPNDANSFGQTFSIKVPPSCLGFAKANGGNVTIKKTWNYQEDICIATTSKAKSKSPSIHHEPVGRTSDTSKRISNSCSQNTPDEVRRKANRKCHELNAVDTVKEQLKNRSRQSTSSNGSAPSNKAKKSLMLGQLNEMGKQDNHCSTSKDIKLTGLKSPARKSKVNGQCENCGHINGLDIMTNKSENGVVQNSNHLTQSNSLSVVSDKRKGRNCKAKK